MGRQISLIASPEGELELEEFLRSCGDLRLFRVFASSPEALAVPTLAAAPTESQLYIWYERFLWVPTYGQTQTETPLTYINNRSAAPIIEYSRPDSPAGSPGRLYWSDRFSGESAYDRAAFSRVVDRIWRWVRKRASRMPDRRGTWFLSGTQLGRVRGRPLH